MHRAPGRAGRRADRGRRRRRGVVRRGARLVRRADRGGRGVKRAHAREHEARGRTQRTMRASRLSSELETALTEFVRAAADCLQAEIDAGAEVELELGSQRGRGVTQTPFYSFRALTGRFIAQRESQLERLPEHAAAVSALAGFDGLNRYLAGRGGETRSGRGDDVLKSGARADRSEIGQHMRARSALKCLLDDVFAEQTEFDRSKIGQHPERLAAALARLERAELTMTSAPDTVTLVATLHGMTIASPEIKLTQGLTIATPEALRWALPEQALARID